MTCPKTSRDAVQRIQGSWRLEGGLWDRGEDSWNSFYLLQGSSWQGMERLGPEGTLWWGPQNGHRSHQLTQPRQVTTPKPETLNFFFRYYKKADMESLEIRHVKIPLGGGGKVSIRWKGSFSYFKFMKIDKFYQGIKCKGPLKKSGILSRKRG